MEQRRVHYIDWLRVLAVLLLIPFHAGRVFNYGEPFYAKSTIESVPIGYFLGLIDAWHMPLLFLLAGASTYFAMKRRSIGQYLGERTLRLLVPLVFGVLVIVPPQTWYGARTNGGYTGSLIDYYTSGFAFDPTNLLGKGDYYGGLSPAHLWFILYLFMISVAVVPLLALDRTERGSTVIARVSAALAKPVWWPLVVLVIMIAEDMPDIAGKNPFFYAAFFTLGYLLIRRGEFADTAEALRYPALVAGALIIAAMVGLWQWRDSLPDPSVVLALTVYVSLAGVWLVIVAIIGFGKRLLDGPSRALSYLAPASYPLYILHQTVIVAIGFYLVKVVPWPALGWPLLMLLSALATVAAYEGVRRIRPLRFFFGIKQARPPAAAAEITPATP